MPISSVCEYIIITCIQYVANVYGSFICSETLKTNKYLKSNNNKLRQHDIHRSDPNQKPLRFHKHPDLIQTCMSHPGVYI